MLAGDSAGGGLALAMALSMRDRGLTPATHLVLHAPWVDLTTSTPETREVDADRPVAVLQQARGVRPVVGRLARADLGRREVSPALADLAGLPKALMLYGTRDLLHPGCRLLARRAAEAGWDLTSIEEPDLIHVYGLLPLIPEARRAFPRSWTSCDERPRPHGRHRRPGPADGVRRVAAAPAGLRGRAGLPLPRPRRPRPRAERRGTSCCSRTTRCVGTLRVLDDGGLGADRPRRGRAGRPAVAGWPRC